ncbi:MAG: hypothetical protein E7535_00105 [Ruminococcaceae bacterium]|nr:hypothetical protein [Oscillospiraceae bacterium]
MKKVLSIILTMLMVFSATPLASAFTIECGHPYGALDGICKECGEEDPLVELEVGVDYPTTCLTQNELEYAKFIPDVTALYAFKSSDYDDGWYGEDGDIIIGGGEGDDSIDWGEFSLAGEGEAVESDPYICIYDANMNLIAENDNDEEPNDDGWFGALNNHFDCKAELEAGKTYYVGVGDKNLDLGQFNYRIEKVLKIAHQPTADEPYVALDYEDNATYQWYIVTENRVEITDANASLVDEAQTPYNAETGWTPVFDESNIASFFRVNLEAGDVVEVQFSKRAVKAYLDPNGIIIGDGTGDDSVDWGDIEGEGDIIIGDGEGDDSITWDEIVNGRGQTDFSLPVSDTFEYDLVAEEVASNSITAKAYRVSKVYTAVDSETAATLGNPVGGSEYLCKVTASDGNVLTSDSFIAEEKEELMIDHQPTNDEPYVTLTGEDAGATYQWFTGAKNRVEITDADAENVDVFNGGYDAEIGWIGVYDDWYEYYSYFMLDLNAGDEVEVVFSEGVTDAYFNVAGGDDGWGDDGWSDWALPRAATNTTFTLTADEANTYFLVAEGATDSTTVRAYFVSEGYAEVEGETTATLVNPVGGNEYFCKVTLSDNTVLTSDSFKAVCTHENAVDDGDCTTAVVCPDCGETTVEANEKHTGGTATCTEQAKCEVCGTAYDDLADHNTDGVVAHKDATCTETGVVGGTYCTACGEGKEEAEAEIPTTAHNTDGVVAHKDASCTETGVVGGTYCTACGEGKEAAEAEIPTTAHNTDGVVAHKDATCTETGVVGGTYCTACGEGKEAAEEVIPLAAHTEQIIKGKKATCKATGLTQGVKCSVCGEILVPQEVIPISTEHTMRTINHRDPTCSVVGIVGGDYCAICRMGFEEARTQIPKLPHTEDIVIPGKPATCQETGLTDGYKCSVCNKITTKQEVIPLADHNQDGVIKHKEPTCYTVGIVGGNFCTVCRYGREEALATIPAKGHNSDGYIEHKDATCTEDGVVGGTYCTDCTNGLSAASKVIPAAHTPGEEVKENITPATCTKNETYELVTYCTVCDEEVSRQLVTGPKLPHTEEIIPAKKATCTGTGLTEGKMCSVCGEILVAQQSTPLEKHNYEDGACTECGATYNCRHICHRAEDNIFAKIVWSIIRFICSIFGVGRTCSCGDMHY